MIKKYIYVFGSNSQCLKLKKEIDEDRFTVVYISEERADKPDYAKNVEELLSEFESSYQDSYEVQAFINFGRTTVIGGIENIAKSWDGIIKKYPVLKNKTFIGPSSPAAKLFFNKKFTWQLFKKMGLPCPQTYEIDMLKNAKANARMLIEMDFPFPAVIKATELSGGRGMIYVSSIDDFQAELDNLLNAGHKELIVSEYIDGLEISFAVLRLGDNFLRFPACYKEHTSVELKHPDSQVKLTGIFKQFDQVYEKIENIMRQEKITGFLYLEAILRQNTHSEYSLKFIEGATRLSGNSVIEFGALKNFNFYRTLATWIDTGGLGFAYENQLCVQYSSFVHHGQEDIKKLLEKEWILEARYEDLATLPFSIDLRKRIRVSFIGGTKEQTQSRAQEIADIFNNQRYGEDINLALDKYYNRYPDLLYVPEKHSEGAWDSDLSWEFFLSDYLPPVDLCTAVFCLALRSNGDIVLARTHRGWELPGGHIEPGESIKDTLFRETMEEAGFIPEHYKLFGYRKITAKRPVSGQKGKYHYPFPISYIPHFIARSTTLPTSFSGAEVIESRSFSEEELRNLNIEVYDIVMAGLRFKNNI